MDSRQKAIQGSLIPIDQRISSIWIDIFTQLLTIFKGDPTIPTLCNRLSKHINANNTVQAVEIISYIREQRLRLLKRLGFFLSVLIMNYGGVFSAFSPLLRAAIFFPVLIYYFPPKEFIRIKLLCFHNFKKEFEMLNQLIEMKQELLCRLEAYQPQQTYSVLIDMLTQSALNLDRTMEEFKKTVTNRLNLYSMKINTITVDSYTLGLKVRGVETIKFMKTTWMPELRKKLQKEIEELAKEGSAEEKKENKSALIP